jgi:predicted outer membrane repeat protein
LCNACGNGHIDPGEECDEGEANSLEPDHCRPDCVSPECGDGVLDTGERCDDGDENDDDLLGACRTDCTRCGDGAIDPERGETCDDGNDDDSDDCPASCQEAWCGDGFVRGGEEECDLGELNSDTEPDACREDCVAPHCGDSVTDTGEGCDDGNDIDDDECTNSCRLPSCGDEIVNGDEECDDGNDSNVDECLETCVFASCGDGFHQIEPEESEECDDGNDSDNDACLGTCEVAFCGDGFVWAGEEECDYGELNSDTEPGMCREDCIEAHCGDGVTDPGELCDGSEGCPEDCMPCGPGLAGEACDVCVRFVAPSVDMARDGLSWGSAFATIQEAVASAYAEVLARRAEYCEVWIAAGMYLSTTVARASDTALVLLYPGVHLYGGFEPGAFSSASRTPMTTRTILSGSDVEGPEGTGVVDHVIEMEEGSANPWGTVIDGLVIVRGLADAAEGDGRRGAGILAAADGLDVWVRRCVFKDNLANAEGGAIAVAGDVTLVVENSLFSGNEAPFGGAISLQGASRGYIVSSSFDANLALDHARGEGAGMGIFFGEEDGDTPEGDVVNCIFDDDEDLDNPRCDEIHDEGHGAEVRSTLIRGCTDENPGTFDGDPRFTPDGRLSLDAGSAAIDQAETCEAPRRDVLGNVRNDILGLGRDRETVPPPDIGAFEYAVASDPSDVVTWRERCWREPEFDEGTGNAFYLAPQVLTWRLARNACEQGGGHLATIGTEGEAAAALATMQAAVLDAWIGGYHMPATAWSDWTWVTGEEWTAPPVTGWTDGCPHVVEREEHCLILSYSSGHACNMRCGEAGAFICEVEP